MKQDKIEAHLENIALPKLTKQQTSICKVTMFKNEVLKSLKLMENNESPGIGELSEEFCECVWDEIEKPFLASIHKAFLDQELSSSQKQTLIKMLQKGKGKRFIKNWKSISLLNTNMKIIIKVLPTTVKNELPFLFFSNQTVYVKNRGVSQSGRVISDILEILFWYFRKAFPSVSHCFLLQILEKLGFGIDFVS